MFSIYSSLLILIICIKAQSNAVKWESKWTHIQNTAAKKTLLLGRIKIATHNLYQVNIEINDN